MNERVLSTLLECPFRKRIAFVLSVLMATLHLVHQYSMHSSWDWSVLIMNLVLLPFVRMAESSAKRQLRTLSLGREVRVENIVEGWDEGTALRCSCLDAAN
ncbi:hypothetical protein AVEN_134286-1 [Araneus ventricosus]|uniref:Uncharacterized protein n=1 Tax=Araneus ventricosus TaxID=182803 RepID=A0A4Y2L0D9_ARAVE|nr:hypothetical protein AVEN_134286-1 [Araneus ventricosus]